MLGQNGSGSDDEVLNFHDYIVKVVPMYEESLLDCHRRKVVFDNDLEVCRSHAMHSMITELPITSHIVSPLQCR